MLSRKPGFVTPTLQILCAGAAQGLVKALQPKWLVETGVPVLGRFGAVGALKDALLAGESCDVMIVTSKMVGELVAAGRLLGAGHIALGRVQTGLAVPAGAVQPDVGTPQGLRAALLAADALYFPDPARATAGIHFARVLRELGIHDLLAPRFCTFPNGATAMRELAAAGAAGGPSTLIGCTQVSEILYTEGVALVSALPAPFELTTAYSAAVCVQARDAALAAQFIALLAGPAAQALRDAGGFEQ